MITEPRTIIDFLNSCTQDNKDREFFGVDNIKREWIRRNIKEGMTAVDVGACVGKFTIPLSEAVGETGTVIAFEPCKENFEVLASEVYGKKNVSLYRYGISNRHMNNAQLRVDRDKEGWNSFDRTSHYYFDRAGRYETLRLRTLDECLGSRKVDFIKIDVEGYELRTLFGAKEVLANNHEITIAMEVHFWNNQHKKVFNFLKNRGFAIFNTHKCFFKDAEIKQPRFITDEVIATRGERYISSTEPLDKEMKKLVNKLLVGE